MSTLKTMKGQAAQYSSVSDWPDDYPVCFCLPLDEGDGAPLDVGDIISGDTVSAILQNTGSNNCDNAGFLGASLSTATPPGTDSFVLFYVGDFPASGTFLAVGSVGDNALVSCSTNASTSTLYKDDIAPVTSATGEVFTASAANQLGMVVIDHDTNLMSIYEGSDGTTLVSTTVIHSGGNWVPATGGIDVDNGSAWANVYGFGLIRFPGGIPSNLPAIMQYIATELRAGRKRQWLNSWIEEYLL